MAKVYLATKDDLSAVQDVVTINADNIEVALAQSISVYTHSASGLSGSGDNGRFKAMVGGEFSSINVNGTACSVRYGENDAIELIKNNWYNFILDGSTINFSQGSTGDSLNFRVLGGATYPKSTSRNLLSDIYRDNQTYSNKGMTYTLNDDSSIAVSGTATENAFFTFAKRIPLEAGKTYTFKNISSPGTMALILSEHDSSDKWIKDLLASDASATQNASFTFNGLQNDGRYVVAKLKIFSGKTISATIYPMLVEGSMGSNEEFVEYKTKQNTIYLKDSVDITSYDLCATEPYLRSGNRNLNVYPYHHTTQTIGGVTFTDNGDGTITANGTGNGSAVFRCSTDSSMNLISVPAGKYTLSGCPTGGGSSKYRVELYYSYDKWVTSTNIKSYGSPVTVDLEYDALVRINIVVSSGTTVSGTIFKPQFEKGSVATEFIKGDATGQVWLITGKISNIEFNGQKKNNMRVILLGAKQYINNAWTSLNTLAFINGSWRDPYPLLVANSTVFPSIVNQPHSGIYPYAYDSGVNLSRMTSMSSDDGWELTIPSGYYSKIMCDTLNQPIDFTNINSVTLHGDGNSLQNSPYFSAIIYVVASLSSSLSGKYLLNSENVNNFVLSGPLAYTRISTNDFNNDDSFTVDVSSVNGVGYIGALIMSANINSAPQLIITDITFN